MSLYKSKCIRISFYFRLMFWTEDKYLSEKYIGVANMDGSDVKHIVTENLQHPMAITIDYNRMC